MAYRFLQANINHCARAQDLIWQSIAEWLIEVAVVAEPYWVPPRENWEGDVDGSVAIILSSVDGASPVSALVRSRGYVAVQWREYVVIGVYFSPNRTLAEFESFLDGMGDVIGQSLPHPVLLVGDLNAKSSAWGSPATDARGRILNEWATLTGLSVLNRGSVNTCVRHNGGSIVDVSFASPAVARLVRDWNVLGDVETLSDHRYIWFDISASLGHPDIRRPATSSPMWVLGSLNREIQVPTVSEAELDAALLRV